jgi:hypothetical protein
MSKFKYKFLILEFNYFDLDRYPEGSNIPAYARKKIKITGNFITSVLVRIQLQYGVHVIMCGNSSYAAYIAESIMKKVAKEYGK